MLGKAKGVELRGVTRMDRLTVSPTVRTVDQKAAKFGRTVQKLVFSPIPEPSEIKECYESRSDSFQDILLPHFINMVFSSWKTLFGMGAVANTDNNGQGSRPDGYIPDPKDPKEPLSAIEVKCLADDSIDSKQIRSHCSDTKRKECYLILFTGDGQVVCRLYNLYSENCPETILCSRQ